MYTLKIKIAIKIVNDKMQLCFLKKTLCLQMTLTRPKM